MCATAATRKRVGPGAGAETCGERPPGRNEARAGSALAALALRAFAQNRARRFAARNDPVRFVRFAAMALSPRTALLPSRHGCAAPGPQRQNHGACRHSAPFRLRRNRAGRSSAPPFGFAAQNRARRFAARNDPVRFVRFAAMASPPRTALLPSRHGCAAPGPQRQNPGACSPPAPFRPRRNRAAVISALLPGTIVNRPGFLYNKRQDSYHT